MLVEAVSLETFSKVSRLGVSELSSACMRLAGHLLA